MILTKLREWDLYQSKAAMIERTCRVDLHLISPDAFVDRTHFTCRVQVKTCFRIQIALHALIGYMVS